MHTNKNTNEENEKLMELKQIFPCIYALLQITYKLKIKFKNSYSI